MINNVTYSPIVLFVYNRPAHTLATLEALIKNEYADKSTLYIYADGPKDSLNESELKSIQEVRLILRQKQWCGTVKIIEKEKNSGLADSIVNGVTEVINKYERVIVLEDDIVTSPGFLKYMNDGLSCYNNHEKVMHISGYMYPYNYVEEETFFFNVPLCWGWATWKRAWENLNVSALDLFKQIDEGNLWYSFNKFGNKELEIQLKKKYYRNLKELVVKWHASLFLKQGFSLYPSKSLVQNVGFDNSGSNTIKTDDFSHKSLAPAIQVLEIPIVENNKAEIIIRDFYTRQTQKYNTKKPAEF